MATVQWKVTAGATTYDYVKTVSGADLTRMIAAARISFGMGAATDQQVSDAIANFIFSSVKGMVRAAELKSAITTAESAVTDIVINGS